MSAAKTRPKSLAFFDSQANQKTILMARASMVQNEPKPIEETKPPQIYDNFQAVDVKGVKSSIFDRVRPTTAIVSRHRKMVVSRHKTPLEY